MLHFLVKEDTNDIAKLLKAVDKHPYMVLLGNTYYCRGVLLIF